MQAHILQAGSLVLQSGSLVTALKADFFGQFLLTKGLINQANLDKAVALQHASNPLLGEFAISLGLLTTAQADQINRQQKREDKRFGDIAIELGFLTAEQMQSVVTLQQRQRKCIGEILVAEGLLSQEQVDAELLLHKEQYDGAVKELEQAIANHPQGQTLENAIDYTSKAFLRTLKSRCHYTSVYANHDEISAFVNTAYIFVKGDFSFTVGISTDNETLVNIASTFVSMDKADCDLEFSRDAFGELLNIILGFMLRETTAELSNYQPSTPDTTVELSALLQSLENSLTVEMFSELGAFILFVGDAPAS